MEKGSDSDKTILFNSYFLAIKEALNKLICALKDRKILAFITITGILLGFFPFFYLVEKTEAGLFQDKNRKNNEELIQKLGSGLVFLQENSLLAISDISIPESQIIRKIPVIVTAYSSTVWETDSDPFITAAGTWVRQGIVANNMLSFGTKIRIPELFGNRIFVVEDRMNRRKSPNHFDIWKSSHSEAKNFGVERTYIEIIKD